MSKQYSEQRTPIDVNEHISPKYFRKTKKKNKKVSLKFEDFEIGQLLIGKFYNTDSSSCRCKCVIVDKFKIQAKSNWDFYRQEFIYCKVIAKLDTYNEDIQGHIFELKYDGSNYRWYSRICIEFEKFHD